jgi:Uncharacterized protein potentially involved in peptidoglycan biosynthesis
MVSIKSRIERWRHRRHNIQKKYKSLNGAEGILGSAKSAQEEVTKDGQGRFKEYQNGVIYWHPSTGAHEVHGAILYKWNALGRETSWLGYPSSDEMQDANGVGRHTKFQHGSIYWFPDTGPHPLRPEIFKLWQDLGGETGRLGYPITDELDGPYGGSRYQQFQNGSYIYWDRERGAYEVLPKVKPFDSSPEVSGSWAVALHNSRVVGIHAALLHTGRVLFFSHGNTRINSGDEQSVEVGSAVLEPSAGTVTQQRLADGTICSGHTFFPDGRLLVCGSERKREGVHAIRVFTPNLNGGDWEQVAEMQAARWYPTCSRLPDGRIAIIGGHKWFRDSNTANATYVIVDRDCGTEKARPIPFLEKGTNALFPFVFVLPSGKLLIHAGTETSFLDLQNFKFDKRPLQAADRPDRNARTYDVQGTAVLLPLLPESDPPYRARVMMIGGGGAPPATAQTPATKSCEILDLDESLLSWKLSAPMSNPRVMPDAVLLPDGNVLVTNGSCTGKADSAANPVHEAELYNPRSDTWTTLAAMKIPRLYHSVALLLPDATVLTAGTDSVWHRASFNEAKLWVETFNPPYLFSGPRPIIQRTPLEISYGVEFEVNTPHAGSISSAALMSPSSVTHSFNSSQRYVGLFITERTANSLKLLSPPNSYVAPPGYYMFFILSDEGVPSFARFLKLG